MASDWGDFFPQGKKALLILGGMRAHITDSANASFGRTESNPAAIPAGTTKCLRLLDNSVDRAFKEPLRG